MTWPNPDRAQLLALAGADDAAHGQCLASAPTYGRVSHIDQPQRSVGAMVAARAKKMQFRSNEARKRYLRVHRALSC